ncbi:MAG: RNA 3'-terminal phosphate cyclase [Pyrinomonadaceae bacterium]|nr:RNA 3'-terminal phosphate cyclase [Pyrinomonadaceae bacterium]
MLSIDGSYGEGGGQIIRTSLALSLVTGKAFRAERVRANRNKPGLQRQHLTAVLSAAEIGQAEVEGARVGATEFTFIPGEVVQGDYNFSIGTAGSATLVMQAVLPPLMLASKPSVLTIEGGTHNTHAPPFEFLQKTFLPLVNRTGRRISMQLERYGFYPPGGGRINVLIEPTEERKRLDIPERGEIQSTRARALVVKLPSHIAERELAVVEQELGWMDEQLEIETSNNALSPGNVVTIEIESEQVTEIFTGIGQRGVRAEAVAQSAVDEAKNYLASGAPIGEHLADQLLIPLALAGGGSYITGALSLHTKTNIEIIKKFLDVKITTLQLSGSLWKIEIQE